MVSLTKIGMAPAPSGVDIKALEVIPGKNEFFAASKGLLIYDFRKLNSTTPYSRIEPNNDIFSLTSTPDYLFFGSRDHQVYPYSTT